MEAPTIRRMMRPRPILRTQRAPYRCFALILLLTTCSSVSLLPDFIGFNSRATAQSLRPFVGQPSAYPNPNLRRGVGRNLQHETQRPLASHPIQIVSENFIVSAQDARLAQQVSREAERFRKELAIEWLGQELGPWQDKCPIKVELGPHAGGETSFAFVTGGLGNNGAGKGVPISWQMKVFGPPDRLLDAVLPHEITHTIFATHFGRPLPRWADEGACTTVEHESERRKNHQMLMDFLGAKPSRGIPFNRMFTMKNYPHDILPLYAQGYSLAKFLIAQKGRRHFLDFVEAGMSAEVPGRELAAWDAATGEFYGFENLSELQMGWLGWVKDGSDVTAVAASQPRDPSQTRPVVTVAPVSFLTAINPPEERNGAQKSSAPPASSPSKIASFVEAPAPGSNLSPVSKMSPVSKPSVAVAAGDSWYARQSKSPSGRVAANRTSNLEAFEGTPLQVLVREEAPVFRSDTIWR